MRGMDVTEAAGPLPEKVLHLLCVSALVSWSAANKATPGIFSTKMLVLPQITSYIFVITVAHLTIYAFPSIQVSFTSIMPAFD